MKKLVTVLVFTFIFIACHTKKQSTTQAEKTKKELISPSFQVSAQTKLFLKQYKVDLDTSEKAESDYSPSEPFIEQYSLKKVNNYYCIKGFAKVNEKFEEETLTKLGAETNSKRGNQLTMTIPLLAMEKFFKSTGIDYFEITVKANLK